MSVSRHIVLGVISAAWLASSGPGFADEGTGMDLEIEGFGQRTVGGWQPGSETVHVTSLADDGPGSLRESVRSHGRPRVVVFDVSGRIELDSAIKLPSNVTIDGRGQKVELFGKGLKMHGAEQVIITHIAIVDVFPNSEDGIHVGHPKYPPSRNIVVDHVSFYQSEGRGHADHADEALSVVHGSHDITVQWSRFEGWEKVMLLGTRKSPQEIDGNISVTLHHNLLINNARRHPRAHHGRFDLYNNAFVDWHAFYRMGPALYNRTYGILCENGCRMRLEENVFAKRPFPYDGFPPSWARSATRCEPRMLNVSSVPGTIESRGRFVLPGSIELGFGVGCPENASAFQRPYPATIAPAGEALLERLLAEAGN